MNNFIIAYDIFDPKRLRKIRKISYSYSLGGQKSALEAPLDKKPKQELYFRSKYVYQYNYNSFVTKQQEKNNA